MKHTIKKYTEYRDKCKYMDPMMITIHYIPFGYFEFNGNWSIL